MYACQLLLLQLLIWASYRHFYFDRLPEAICCCLQPYTVIDVLLIGEQERANLVVRLARFFC